MITDWSQMEHAALTIFLTAPGSLRLALERFIADLSQEQKAMCATSMSTVPRDPERAADYAAKSQILDEFWSLLEDSLRSYEHESFATPSGEPTTRD